MSISPSAGTPCGCWTGSEEQKPVSTNLSRTEASFTLVLPSSSHLNQTLVFYRTLDQVKEDVGQTEFLTNVVSPFRVRGQNQVAQALQWLEETDSFNFSTCQLGKKKINQCVINGLMAEWT